MFGMRSAVSLVVVTLVVTTVVGSAIAVTLAYRTIRQLHDQVTTLSIETKALSAANTAMQHEIEVITEAQIEANRRMSDSRRSAAASSKAVKERKFDATAPGDVQTEANRQTNAAFQRLQDLSNER